MLLSVSASETTKIAVGVFEQTKNLFFGVKLSDMRCLSTFHADGVTS